ncbi:hypothetical protein [Streptomyces tirandamycinicus]|uniref:ATP-binding protein n=1 Tax=Streptomyces tirandamycinicus TaxID=2174846 RepID=A0A2S1T1Y5_9ACTN|nr:hypothetical protein [Streptomyces tirandamycinicus]AWI32660.1 hypothetical protein DDW44_30550 [Streptomyces tirandamycinicus]
MTTTPEHWTPPDGRRFEPWLTLPKGPSFLLKRPALPNGLAVTRRTRFPVPANGTAAIQARTVIRPVLMLMLGIGELAETLTRRIETCLSELVAVAYTHTSDDHLLCSVWTDAEHAFLSVEHDQPLPQDDDSTMYLHVVRALADDYGTHVSEGTHQTWVALRRP